MVVINYLTMLSVIVVIVKLTVIFLHFRVFINIKKILKFENYKKWLVLKFDIVMRERN